MAPVCAHDCFHAHWRWSDEATSRGVLGWSEAQPYEKEGAPLVPRNHTVRLWLDAENLAVIHEIADCQGATSTHEEKLIAADHWEIFHYQGWAYVVSARTSSLKAAKLFVQEKVDWQFLTTDGGFMGPSDSWALFYWCLRYKIEFPLIGKPKISERVQR